jgi:hypothetical protein
MAFATYSNDAPLPLESRGEESSHFIPKPIGEARIVNIDGSVYQTNNVATHLRAALDSFGGSQTYEDAMAGPTREEIDAKLEAVEARSERRFTELSGKIDRIADSIVNFNSTVRENLSDLRAEITGLRGEMTAVRTDNKFTRVSIIVAVVASVLAGLGALWVTNTLILTAFQSGISAKSETPTPKTDTR